MSIKWVHACLIHRQMLGVQLMNIAGDKEFSIRLLGEMLRETEEVGLYLRRESIG